MNKKEINDIPYRVLYLMTSGETCGCDELCKCNSIAVDLYYLLMKIKG